MAYSEESITELAKGYREWHERERALSERLVTRVYREDGSRILAAQGLTRRLHTLRRCMEHVYNLLPPDAHEPPREAIDEAAIFLQAFVINAYGALDNLARLWIWESGLHGPKGKPVPQKWIGLGPNHEFVRSSLSQPFRDYLEGTSAWFTYLENYRHALAHRIPLYIPPRRLDDEAAKLYRRMEADMMVALKARDFDRYGELLGQQSRLGVFEPWMVHSVGPAEDDGRPVMFHGQLICDLATVVEIGEKMMAELDSLV